MSRLQNAGIVHTLCAQSSQAADHPDFRLLSRGLKQ